jgi:hypothetical protein
MAILAGRVKILRETGQFILPNSEVGTTPQSMTPQTMTGMYNAIFEIEGRTVSLTRYSPIIIILDGDEVVVSGTVKDDGIFHATAFENMTRGVRGNNAINTYMPFITGSCFAMVVFFWFMAFGPLGGDSLFFWMAIAMTVLLFGSDWYARSYNSRMSDDANQVRDYVESLKITGPN